MKARPKKQAVAPAPTPSIVVQVPREDRLESIATLARAVELLAKALTVAPSVNLSNFSVVNAAQDGVRIEALGQSETSAWTLAL